LALTDWDRIDVMTDADIARRIASDPDAAPDMPPEPQQAAAKQYGFGLINSE